MHRRYVGKVTALANTVGRDPSGMSCAALLGILARPRSWGLSREQAQSVLSPDSNHKSLDKSVRLKIFLAV